MIVPVGLYPGGIVLVNLIRHNLAFTPQVFRPADTQALGNPAGAEPPGGALATEAIVKPSVSG